MPLPSPPATAVAGTVLTAAWLNTNLRDYITAMYAGALGLSGQSAYDLFGASSSSQLARIANGVTGQVLVATTGAMPSWGAGPVARYTATLTNVVSTSARTTTVSFTIPANAMADGDVIEIVITSLEKNNTGVPDQVLFGFTAGAGSNVTLETTGFSDSATERKNIKHVTLQRVGSTIYGCIAPNRTDGLSQVPGFVVDTSTPTNFTSDFTLAITADFTGSDASLYYKPQAAKVLHYKG